MNDTTTIVLPSNTCGMTYEVKTAAKDTVHTLRNCISGTLHDEILCQMLIEECNSKLRLDMSVRELIEKLS